MVGEDGRLRARVGQTFPNAPLPTTLSNLKWKRVTSPSKSMGCERQQTAPMVRWRERRRKDLGRHPWSEKDQLRFQVHPATTTFILIFVPIPSKTSAAQSPRVPRNGARALRLATADHLRQGMRPRTAILGPWTTQPLWFSYSVVVARRLSCVHPSIPS